MSTAHKCPVCEGFGRVRCYPGPSTISTNAVINTCPACQGTGVVWSEDTSVNQIMLEALEKIVEEHECLTSHIVIDIAQAAIDAAGGGEKNGR